MQGSSVARAGGGYLRAGHVTIGREGDVTIPARLQAHLFCKHLHRADGNEQMGPKGHGEKGQWEQWRGWGRSPTLLLSSSSKEK